MKRKGRSPAEEQHEACDIWLDPSALKKCKMQNVIAKCALRMANRPLLYPASEKVPLPFTKQTTISTFFRSHPGGERKTNTNSGLSSIASKSDCSLQGGKGEKRYLFLPVQEFKHIQHDALQASALSNNRWTAPAKGGKYTADDTLDSAQHLEANAEIERAAVSSSPWRGENGGQRTFNILSSPSSRNLKALRRNGSCSTCSKGHLSNFSDSENMDPQLDRWGTAMQRKDFNQNRVGILSETATALCGSKNSQLGCASPLFSQDSEGHRVISYCFSGERGSLCLPKQPLQDKSNQEGSPAYRDCYGVCYLPESESQLAAGMDLPAGAEIRLNSCYDLLFTEDSEGNRVIKH